MKSILSGAIIAAVIVVSLTLNVEAKSIHAPATATSDTGKMAKMSKMSKKKMSKKKMSKDTSGKM